MNQTESQIMKFSAVENISAAAPDPVNTNNSNIHPTHTKILHDRFDLTTTLQRYQENRLCGRKAPCWGFFSHITDDEYFCVLCDPDPSAAGALNKKEKKGLVSYKSSVGTNSLKRHIKFHHPEELHVLESKLRDMDEKATAPRKELKFKRKFFNTHIPYGESSEGQKKYNQDLVLLVAKAALPLSIVGNPHFLRYVHTINPGIKVPNRRKLTEVLIPSFIAHCTEKYVLPKLRSFDSVTISFDLWMSRGCQDIFDLIAHGLDENFENESVHLKLVECNATTGFALASVLEEELTNYRLLSKFIACVKDGGSNLKSCTGAIRMSATCDNLGLDHIFDGTCFAHILSACCNAALSSEICSDLSEVNISKTKSLLQKCITWTKKSGKGREEWYKACREAKRKERLMSPPIKTRFVSAFVMLKMMLDYRDVVEHCFSKQPDIKLCERVPSASVWEVGRVVCETLEPVMFPLHLDTSKRLCQDAEENRLDAERCCCSRLQLVFTLYSYYQKWKYL